MRRAMVPKVLESITFIARDITEQSRLRVLAQEQAEITQKLAEVGAAVASTLDRDTVVQKVIDIATALTRAEFGAFFYNAMNDAGEAYTLYTVSGVPREMFSPMGLLALADVLPVMTAYVDRHERYRFLNKPLAEWFERPRSEILGRTLREVLGEA